MQQKLATLQRAMTSCTARRTGCANSRLPGCSVSATGVACSWGVASAVLRWSCRVLCCCCSHSCMVRVDVVAPGVTHSKLRVPVHPLERRRLGHHRSDGRRASSTRPAALAGSASVRARFGASSVSPPRVKHCWPCTPHMAACRDTARQRHTLTGGMAACASLGCRVREPGMLHLSKIGSILLA